MLADFFSDIEKWVKANVTISMSNVDSSNTLATHLIRVLAQIEDDECAVRVYMDPQHNHFAVTNFLNIFICQNTMDKELIEEFDSIRLKKANASLHHQLMVARDDAARDNILRQRAELYLEMRADPKYHQWRHDLVDKMATDMMTELAPVIYNADPVEARRKLVELFTRAVRIGIRMRQDPIMWFFEFPQNNDTLVQSMVCRNTDVIVHEVRSNYR
jgi:hypothetical protein